MTNFLDEYKDENNLKTQLDKVLNLIPGTKTNKNLNWKLNILVFFDQIKGEGKSGHLQNVKMLGLHYLIFGLKSEYVPL